MAVKLKPQPPQSELSKLIKEQRADSWKDRERTRRDRPSKHLSKKRK